MGNKLVKLLDDRESRNYPSIGLNNITFISKAHETQSNLSLLSKSIVDSKIMVVPVLFEEHIKTISVFTSSIESFTKNMKALTDMISSISKIDEISKSILTNAKKLSKYQKLLLDYGWAYCYEFEASKLSQVGECLENGEIELANKLVAEHYKLYLDGIFQVLVERHSNRKDIILEIQEGYNNGLYSLCIPTILSQIDGICNDEVGEKFFNSKEINNYNSTAMVKVHEKENEKLLRGLLLESNYINDNEMYLSNYKIRLNRHEIIHGTDYKYGNEINFLRVMSIFEFVSSTLEEYKNNKNV